MTTPDLIVQTDCRKAFESYLATTGYLRNVRPDGKYESSHAQIVWEAWEACWMYRQENMEEMKDAMVAMSDSLGILAND